MRGLSRQSRSGARRIGLLLAAVTLLGASATSLMAQTGRVVGRVLASDGSVIPFAAVQWEGAPGWTAVRGDGNYALQVPVGTRTIRAQALGYRTASQTVDVSAGGTATVDFNLDTRALDVAGISVSVLRPDLTPATELEEREVREANPKDAGELLREMEGVDAVRRGPLGLDPVVRGLRETEVGTYLDGTRLFPAGPARMDSPLTHLDPAAVRNIEVIKGPYALTWGAGNLSAIRVETQELPTVAMRPRGSVAAGYDSNLNAQETSANVYGRGGSLGYSFDAAWRQGDDYKSGNGTIIPGDFQSWEGRGKLGVDVGDGGRFIVAGGYQKQGPIDYPGRLLTAESFKAPNVSGTFEWEGTGMLRSFEAKAYRNRVDHEMSNRGKPTENDAAMRPVPCALDIGVDTEITVLGGRADAQFDFDGPWSGELGGDIYSANRNALRTIAKSPTAALLCNTPLDNPGAALRDHMWPDATITDAGTFARVAWREGAWSLSGTARLDFVLAGAAEDSVSSFFYANNPSGSDLEAHETNVSGAMTASVDLNPNWVLALGLGSAVRTADATERYSDRIPGTKAQFAAEFMGNPQLRPERSTQGDLWVDGTLTDLDLHLGVFARRVNDFITIESTTLPTRLPLSPPTVFQYVNGQATFFGVDAHAVVGLTDVLTASATGSYLYGQDDAVGEPAIGVAPTKGTVGLRYEEAMGRYYVEGTLNLVGKQTRVSASRNEGTTPGYQTGDIRAGYGLANGFTLRGGILNVLNKEYFNHLNARDPFSMPLFNPVAEPGRVFFIDVAMAF